MKRKVSLLLVFAMLFSMFSFTNVALAADFEEENQKAYIEIPLDNVSDTDTKVELLFNVNSSSAQKINVFAMDDTFDENITWATAPNNIAQGFDAQNVGSVVVKNAGECSVDVTDVVKAKKAEGKENITFALSGEIRNGLTTDFSDWDNVNIVTTSKNVAYGTEGNAIRGGQDGTTSATISTDYDHTMGYGRSLRLQKSSVSSTYRYKFYNGLKSDGMLTSEDVGRKFEVSFWVKNNSDTALNMAVGFMSAHTGHGTAESPTGKATNFVGTSYTVTTTKAEGWVEHSFTYTVTQDTVNYQAGMLTFDNGFLDVYIDDLSVKDISTPITNITASDLTYAPIFENLTTEDYCRRAETTITTNNIYHTSEYAYRCGNSGGAAITITDLANYPNGTIGKALRVTGNTESETGAGRLKFYNAIKKSALTEDDIGRKFRIEAYLKTQYADSANISLCMMSEKGTSPHGATTTVTANKNDWTKISLDYTLDAKNVADQCGMPTFVVPEVSNHYFIDNFTVTEVTEDATNLKAPRIKITKADSTVAYGLSTKVACIEDGDNAYTVMDNTTIKINDKGVSAVRNDLQVIEENWVGTFVAGNKYGYKKVLRNNTENPVKALLITALFDPNNNLVAANVDNNDNNAIGVGEIVVYETLVTLPKATLEDGYYVKSMLWNGEDMMPLDETNEYPVYYDPQEVVVVVYDKAVGADYSSFDVYVKGTKKTSNMYTMYKFQHINNPRVEQDYTSTANTGQDATLYRVKTAFKAARTGEFTFTSGTQVLQEGEIEMAVKEASNAATNNKTAGDFIGGFHGDEHLTSVSLKIDGVDIPLDKAGNYVGRRIEFDQYSVVNRCNTPEDKLINHTKKYVVTKDGIDLNQTAQWLADTKINVAYLTMFTIMRQPTKTSPRVTDYMKFYWSDGSEAAYYDVSNIGYNTYINDIPELGQTAGATFGYSYAPGDIRTKDDGTYVNKVHLWSAAGDIDAYVWTETVRGLNNSFANLTAREYGDNKIYFGSHSSEYVKTGDVWEVNNHYDIKVND